MPVTFVVIKSFMIDVCTPLPKSKLQWKIKTETATGGAS